jgi:hypothetical protein
MEIVMFHTARRMGGVMDFQMSAGIISEKTLE